MSTDMLAALKKLSRMRDVAYAELVRTACREYIVKNAMQIASDHAAMDGAK
jgi:hypothetical protein